MAKSKWVKKYDLIYCEECCYDAPYQECESYDHNDRIDISFIQAKTKYCPHCGSKMDNSDDYEVFMNG